jgi:hypothetical protein
MLNLNASRLHKATLDSFKNNNDGNDIPPVQPRDVNCQSQNEPV